jgi:hypothetical protein
MLTSNFMQSKQLRVGVVRTPEVRSLEICVNHRSQHTLRAIYIHCSLVVHEFDVLEDCGVL